MLFDDRLATVLRHRATGERAARTQFRQLLDLLGRAQKGSDESLRAAAWLRLAALGESIPATDRAAMIRDPGLRFHSAELAAHFAEDEPVVASAALSTAQLREEDWEALIPRLPVRARGFLRLRDDLPPGAMRLLDRLGVSDRGLPLPDPPPANRVARIEEPAAREPVEPPTPANDGQRAQRPPSVAIGTLVQRIEDFQRQRSQRGTAAFSSEAPRLPLGETAPDEAPPLLGFAFTTDAVGRIDWAEPQVAPAALHMALPPLLDAGASRAFARRLPIERVPLSIEGAPLVSGNWLCDAAPRFTRGEGRFFGYAGRLRRSRAERGLAHETARNDGGDGLRQLLHELRTPVNAIQGFAELIQQQLFGPVPHEYRALAANIAGDSARMLAGFDELDRLAKLESGAIAIEAGEADHSEILTAITERLETILSPRNAGFSIDRQDGLIVGLSPEALEAILWRILAGLSASLAAGERRKASLVGDPRKTWLEIALPAALSGEKDLFAGDARKVAGAASAGAFGPGFALRLARAEAIAAGGELARVEDRLVLTLPRLTGGEAEPSDETVRGSEEGRSVGVP